MMDVEANKYKAERRPLLLETDTPKESPEILKLLEVVDKVTKAMQEQKWKWVSC